MPNPTKSPPGPGVTYLCARAMTEREGAGRDANSGDAVIDKPTPQPGSADLRARFVLGVIAWSGPRC